MGWRGKFKSLKIGKKILIFNLVLFVIPCIVLSLLLFYLVQKEAYQELDNSRMVILNQIDENFEDIFSEVVSYSNYFFCNSRTIYSNLEYELELLGNNGYNYSSLDTGEQIIDYPVLEKLEQEEWYSNFEKSSSYIQYIPVFDSAELKEGEKGVFRGNLNGKKHQIYFTANLTTGWKILMYDESRQSAWEGNRTLLIVVGIYVIYLLLAMIMSFYNARYMSKPLKKLRQDINTITEGDLSVRTEIEAMDEFGELNQQFLIQRTLLCLYLQCIHGFLSCPVHGIHQIADRFKNSFLNSLLLYSFA